MSSDLSAAFRQVAKQVRLGLGAEEAKGNTAKIMVVGGKAGGKREGRKGGRAQEGKEGKKQREKKNENRVLSHAPQGVSTLKRLYGDRFSTTFEDQLFGFGKCRCRFVRQKDVSPNQCEKDAFRTPGVLKGALHLRGSIFDR